MSERKAIAIPVETTTIDMETGEETGRTITSAMMMPAPAGTCPMCATAHGEAEPHNAQSLFYQYAFYAESGGRWPTWNDAMEHCSEEMKEIVRGVLAKHNIDPAGGKLKPASQSG